MSTTQVSSASTTAEPVGAPVPLRLEVVTLPVADVERSKSFYQRLGWRLDADIAAGDGFRVVQFTPPQSQASIHFGDGLTTAEPGSVARLYLAVDDMEAARADLISRGAEVSEVFHYERGPGHSGEFDSRVPGPDTEHGSVLHLCVVQRPGRQRLAAPGDHRPASRPGMGGLTWRSPPWPICCTRPPTITAHSRRSPRRTTGGTGTRRTCTHGEREHAGRGRRGGRALHGRGQARRSATCVRASAVARAVRIANHCLQGAHHEQQHLRPIQQWRRRRNRGPGSTCTSTAAAAAIAA